MLRPLRDLFRRLTHSASIVETAETAYITMSPSGEQNNLLDPYDVPRIEDVAWHLSRINRFTGAIRVPCYSVAEHCVRVSRLCDKYPIEGLLHDEAEACYGDMNSPLKHTARMAPYRDLENSRMSVAFDQLGLVWPLPEEVHYWDKWVGNWEYGHIVAPPRPNCIPQFEIDLVESRWASLGPLGWDPLTARTRFLARFEALMRQQGEAGLSL